MIDLAKAQILDKYGVAFEGDDETILYSLVGDVGSPMGLDQAINTIYVQLDNPGLWIKVGASVRDWVNIQNYVCFPFREFALGFLPYDDSDSSGLLDGGDLGQDYKGEVTADGGEL